MRKEIIVGLIVFAVSAPIGYFTNSYLSRDKVSIENLEIVPITSKLKIDTKDLAEIDSFGGFGFYGGSFMQQELPDEIDRGQISWLKRSLNKKKVNSEIYLKRVHGSLNVIKSKSSNAKAKDLLSSIDRNSLSQIYFDPKEITKNEVEDILKRQITSIESHIQNIEQLINKLSTYKEIRTGEFRIAATLLNSGDTDGLVKYKGSILVKGYPGEVPVEIKKAEYSSINNSFMYGYSVNLATESKSTSVRKRSMVELVFSVPDENQDDKLVKEIQALVKVNRPLDIQLNLTDFRNEKISSEFYKLYATD